MTKTEYAKIAVFGSAFWVSVWILLWMIEAL